MAEQAKKQSVAITLFAIGVFMAALDNGIISAALTTIYSSFDVSPTIGSWGITLYTLGLAISVPIVGKLSDKYGRKKLFIIEIAIFGIGSLLVALSPTFEFFLGARLLQSLGGGGIFIIGSSYVLSTMPKEQHGKALGMLGGMNGIAAVLGPNIGSFLLDMTGSWHWLFLINIPIAIVLVIFGVMKLEENKAGKTSALDFIGTILLSASILLVMLALTNLDGVNVVDSLIKLNVYGYLLGGIVLFAMLLFYEGKLERNGKDPILPISLLRKPQYLLTLLIGVGSGALIASIIFIPSYAEQVIGITQSRSGYWMTPLALASGVGAALGGVFVDKKGPVFTVLLSGIIGTIGFALFPIWVDSTLSFVVASVIAGVGFGILLGAPVNVLATEGAGDNQGSALGTLSLTRQIGLTLAPTLYAGFLTRNFQTIPTEITNSLEEVGLDVSSMPSGAAGSGEMSAASVENMLQKLQEMGVPNLPSVDKVMTAVTEAVQNVYQQAYGGLYLTAAIISIIIIALGITLSLVRKQSKEVG